MDSVDELLMMSAVEGTHKKMKREGKKVLIEN
jgi:hypothetical protein